MLDVYEPAFRPRDITCPICSRQMQHETFFVRFGKGLIIKYRCDHCNEKFIVTNESYSKDEKRLQKEITKIASKWAVDDA